MVLWAVQVSIPGMCSLHSVNPMLNVSLSFFRKADNTIQTLGTDVLNKEKTWEVIEHDLGGQRRNKLCKSLESPASSCRKLYLIFS